MTGILLCLTLLNVSNLFAANLYVDKNLVTECLAGNYSITSRNCNGNNGNAYKTVQGAIDAMSGGDDIFLREGVYQEGHIGITPPKNGSPGNWSSLQSLGGEWAVLDGQRNIEIDSPAFGSVIGFGASGRSESEQIKYWKFERLEITGGGMSGSNSASGFTGNGGPFHFRYVYVHDNLADQCNNNPGGLTGVAWEDSIVEYSFFENNGSLSMETHNCAHLNIFSDYAPNAIAEDGYPLPTTTISNARNEYRFNLFIGSYVAIKYKQDQFFTGRNPTGGNPYVDDFKTYGDSSSQYNHRLKHRNHCKTGLYSDIQ